MEWELREVNRVVGNYKSKEKIKQTNALPDGWHLKSLSIDAHWLRRNWQPYHFHLMEQKSMPDCFVRGPQFLDSLDVARVPQHMEGQEATNQCVTWWAAGAISCFVSQNNLKVCSQESRVEGMNDAFLANFPGHIFSKPGKISQIYFLFFSFLSFFIFWGTTDWTPMYWQACYMASMLPAFRVLILSQGIAELLSYPGLTSSCSFLASASHSAGSTGMCHHIWKISTLESNICKDLGPFLQYSFSIPPGTCYGRALGNIEEFALQIQDNKAPFSLCPTAPRPYPRTFDIHVWGCGLVTVKKAKGRH